MDHPQGYPVDIVIVNYNTYDDTVKCIGKLMEIEAVPAANLYVVDNLSPDGSGARLKTDLPEGVNFIQSDRNGGFGAGVNLGARAGSSPFILVLNPDCWPKEPSLQKAIDHCMANPDVGIAGLHLLNPDGTSQYSARTFYSLLTIAIRRTPLKKIWPFSQMNRRHMMMDHPHTAAFDADWVMGTGLMVRRDLYTQIDGMDETYFLYMEDVDLCLRAQIAGYRVQMLPFAPFTHDHRQQSRKSLWSKAHSFHLQSMKLFARRFGMPLFRRPKVAAMAKHRERHPG